MIAEISARSKVSSAPTSIPHASLVLTRPTAPPAFRPHGSGILRRIGRDFSGGAPGASRPSQDFIDPTVHESHAWGADYILLIVAALPEGEPVARARLYRSAGCVEATMRRAGRSGHALIGISNQPADLRNPVEATLRWSIGYLLTAGDRKRHRQSRGRGRSSLKSERMPSGERVRGSRGPGKELSRLFSGG